ncbi:MAG: hypothetical protein M3Q81_01265 [bacterium]|nr:hypothetical protein [bacterium]
MSKQELIKLIIFFTGWRTVLFLVQLIAPFLLPYKPSFPYYDTLLPFFGVPRWLYSWANFDGVHYLTIIREGYGTHNLLQAFFPLYPFLTKAFSQVVPNPLLIGLLLSNLFGLGFCLLWFTAVKKLYNAHTAWLAVFILFLFPSAFFIGALYTESLFLLLIAGSLVAGYYRKWWLAGILAALASGTRIVGIMLVPALLVELFQQSFHYETSLGKSVQRSLSDILRQQKAALLWIALGSGGLVSYMAYLYHSFGDAMMFLSVQSEFNTGRQENFVLLPQVFWRSIKILLTVDPYGPHYVTYVMEFLTALLFIPAIYLAWRKKVRWSWITFSIIVYLVPTMTGTFSGLNRYILPCLAVFLALTLFLSSKPRLSYLYLVFSATLLIINTILFIQGYWVA